VLHYCGTVLLQLCQAESDSSYHLLMEMVVIHLIMTQTLTITHKLYHGEGERVVRNDFN